MKRNSLIKRIAVGVMAFSLIIPAVPASAHYAYDPYEPETDGVTIKTTRIDNLKIENNDIVVEASAKRIKVKTNVQFYLDCSVDCDWYSNDGLVIDQDTGLVQVPTEQPAGTYHVTAEAKNVQTTGDTISTWSVVVGDQPAKATSVKLVEADDGQVKITENSITVKGTVNNYPIETIITPSYLEDSSVRLASGTPSVNCNYNGDSDNTIDTLAKTTNSDISATVGALGATEDRKVFDSCFKVSVSELAYKASWVSNDDELDSKVTDGKTYNIPADKYAYFSLQDNANITLPAEGVHHCEWVFANNSESKYPSDTYINIIAGTTGDVLTSGRITVMGIDKSNTPSIAGIITYDQMGRVNVTTSPDADKLSVPEVQLTPTVFHSNSTTDYTAVKVLVLNIGNNGTATVDSVDFNFGNVGYKEGRDYSIRKEDIGNEKDVDVYYFNADDGTIDLSKVIDTTNRNVISFENSRQNNFSDNNNVYGAEFKVAKIPNNSFGTITSKYQVQEAAFWNTDNISGTGVVQRVNDGSVDDGKFLLHKNGIGYVTLTATVSSSSSSHSKTIYVRFVSPSNCNFVLEDQAGGVYAGSEVVHIRKGEAVQPVIVGQVRAFTEYNEFADITFEDVNGESINDGDIVSVMTDNNGNIKINGLKPGFVKVIFTDRVNPNISDYLFITVNNDLLTADEYEFNFSDAIEKDYMTSTSVVNGKQSKIALRIRAVTSQNNLGEWSASDFDFSIENDPTGEFAEIKDGFLVTKKATTDKIKLVAKVKGDNEPIATAEFVINDVKADGISKVGVEASNTTVTTTADNAGTCEVGTEFNLIPTALLPENATSSDITITDWASQNPSIATVEKSAKSTGTVKTLAAGTTVITAHYSTGSSIKDLTYTLTVTESNKIKKIVPANDSITLNRAQATATIEFTTVPSLENALVEFVANDPSIIDVNPTTGVITAKKSGTTTVTITSKDDSSVKATITVTVEGIDDVVPSDKAVEDVKSAINAIGTVTADAASKAKIDAARAAYDKLTEEQKNAVGVTLLTTLTSAETSYTTAKAAADKAAADKAATDKAAAEKAAAEKAAADAAAAQAAQAAAELAKAQSVKSVQPAATAKNLKGKKIKVTVAAVDGAAGYQVKYSLKKTMKSAKTKKISGTTLTLKSLKKKTYYIQVRAFSTYNGTTYYSKWSKKKTVKVKK